MMSLLTAGLDKLCCYKVQERNYHTVRPCNSSEYEIYQQISECEEVINEWSKAFTACTATTFAFTLQMKKMQQDWVHYARSQRR
jgi:hypothetical protein